MSEDAKAMKRGCSLLRIKPERVDDYLEAHQVWPELLEVMRDAGMRKFSLFLQRDSGLAVMYFESADPAESLRQVGETDVSYRWEEGMAEFFVEESEGRGDGQEEWLEEYFHLD